jgi:TonB family protein
MTCLRDGELQEYLSEPAASGARARVETHLASCMTCRSAFDRLAATNAYVDGLLSTLVAVDWSANTDRALAGVRRRVEESSRRLVALRWWTASATVSVLLVVLFGLWQVMRSDRDREPAAIATTVALAPSRDLQAQTAPSQAPNRSPSPRQVLKNPVILRATEPEYTADALRAHVEGDVQLEAVVLRDGTVGYVRVTKSLDKTRGLDDEAIRCARRWTFQPARDAQDRAMAMPVSLVVQFRVNEQTAAPPGPRPFEDAFAQGAYGPDVTGIVLPQLLTQRAARYTSDALRSRIQGDVVVEAVVLPDGTVGNVRVVETLDPVEGLDDEAVAAVKQWTYLPATLNGRPVSVLVTLTVPFRLH